MSEKRKTRHFHAGGTGVKLGGELFIEVRESNGRLFVSKSGKFFRHGRIVLGAKERDGYRRISVGGRAHAVTARIVWEVFSGEEIPEGFEIDHINTVRDDNRFENLRVVTHRDNLLNETTRPRRRTACAQNGRKGALVQPREQILKNMAIGHRRHKKPVRCLNDGVVVATYPTIKDATRATGIHGSLIINVARGRAKSAGGFQWQYMKEA